MSLPQTRRVSSPFLALLLGLLAACGGTSRDGAGDAAGGSSGGGRTGSGGGPGSSCQYQGQTYDDGASFPALDGCNKCGCEAGAVSCTKEACDSCQALEQDYAAALEQAKSCDPKSAGQCGKTLGDSLTCGCEIFVNPDNKEFLAAAEAAQDAHASLACRQNVNCGACLPPASSHCSVDGRCEPVAAFGPDAACKVNGFTYPTGKGGIPDPVSCNTCECQDGQLLCTEIGCPIECPSGSAYGTQCAQCGASDSCEVVEHGCLPVCNDACKQGACIDGLCKSLCG